MATRKLYYENAFAQDFTAVVESCEAVKGGFAVALDRTAFYPEGGGPTTAHWASPACWMYTRRTVSSPTCATGRCP